MSKRELTYIGELPPGKWETALWDGALILVCPDHPPYILQDGKLSKLEFEVKDERT